jgi:hypothetical protein
MRTSVAIHHKIILTLFAAFAFAQLAIADCNGALVSKNQLEAAYFNLAASGKLLTQDASYLPRSNCGGTCASIGATNVILTLAETFQPGAISQLPNRSPLKRSTRKINKAILAALLEKYRQKTGDDPTEGAYTSEFEDIIPQVYERIFGHLKSKISFRELGKWDLQSLHPNSNVTVMLSVATETTGHQLNLLKVLPPTKKSTAENPNFYDFRVQVSDPHQPGDIKTLKVYNNGGFFLEGYGNPVRVHSYGKTAEVIAGHIYQAYVVSIDPEEPGQHWDEQSVLKALGGSDAGVHADITLRDGTRYHQVLTYPSSIFRANSIFFYHRYYERASIPYSEIADIQLVENRVP